MSSLITCLPAGKRMRLLLRICGVAQRGSALDPVVGFSGETGFDAEVMVLDFLVSQFFGLEGNAVVDQVIIPGCSG